MTVMLEQLPTDLPEIMKIPYVAKRGLLGYTSITSVRKLITRGDVEAINLADKGEQIDKLRITKKAIVDFWKRRQEVGKKPSAVKPQRKAKSPARKVPRKRDE